MKLILWVLQGLLRLVALCVILYYTLICSIMIVRRGPRWWMRRSWDEVYDVQDRLNELNFRKPSGEAKQDENCHDLYRRRLFRQSRSREAGAPF